MGDPDDVIHLSRDVALVLFELLSRAGPNGTVRPVDSAEQRALWDLEAELEKLLPEPFLPNYDELLDEARKRLRADQEAAPAVPGLVAFVDVDDTLVRSAGSKRIPRPDVIRRVRDLHASGAELYCWSTAGAQYSYTSAVELGIAECFSGFLAKPNVLIDDQPLAKWRGLVWLHPNEASSMSIPEIEAAARAAARTSSSSG